MSMVPRPPVAQGWAAQRPKTGKSDARGPQARLDPAQFDALLAKHGIDVMVYRTVMCPNVKSLDNAEHQIYCEVCKDTGFLDLNPIKTKILLTSQDMTRKFLAEGGYDGNSVSATLQSGIEVQYYTLIELISQTDLHNMELYRRSAGQMDVLRYRARQIHLVVDQFGRQYAPGSDFTLSEDGNLVWVPLRGPEVDTFYSISYEANIQFRAAHAMHVHRYLQVPDGPGQVKFVKGPQQWMLFREFLYRRKDSKGNLIPPNLIRTYVEPAE